MESDAAGGGALFLTLAGFTHSRAILVNVSKEKEDGKFHASFPVFEIGFTVWLQIIHGARAIDPMNRFPLQMETVS